MKYRVQGLGYIPAMCVPHQYITQSNGLPRSDDSDAMIWRHPELPLIGIDENAAFVVSNGQARVVSGDGIAGCVVKRLIVEVVEAKLDSNQPKQLQATSFREAHGFIDLKQLLQGKLSR
jgi:cyanophycinase-like exopeptidase